MHWFAVILVFMKSSRHLEFRKKFRAFWKKNGKICLCAYLKRRRYKKKFDITSSFDVHAVLPLSKTLLYKTWNCENVSFRKGNNSINYEFFSFIIPYKGVIAVSLSFCFFDMYRIMHRFAGMLVFMKNGGHLVFWKIDKNLKKQRYTVAYLTSQRQNIKFVF